MTEEKGLRRVGLALSGGAARGAAHVGVLKVLIDHKIPVHSVAGTSAGAIVAGGYAAGLSIDRLYNLGRLMRWRNVGRVTLSKLGIQSNERLATLIREHFPITRFEDLQMPFAAVAADLHTGETVVMKERGDMARAIQASCALPGWYVPVTDEHGRQLVDGGIIANIPAEAARALGAEIVVAIDVNHEGAKFMGAPVSVFGVLMQSLVLVQRAASAAQLRHADVCICPRVGHIRWDEVSRFDELIEAGAQATREKIDEIKNMLEQRRV